MKRILYFIFILATVVVRGWSQNVKVPEWEKFVQINKDGVNLRKAPNTQSARLMVRVQEIEMTYVSTLSWTPGTGKKPFCLSENDIVPVIEEVGDWYHIYIDGYWDIQDAFIRRDFCSTIEPMTPMFDEKHWNVNFKVSGISNLYFHYEENDMDGDFSPMIGKPFGIGVVWYEYDGLFEYLLTIVGKNSYGGLDMSRKNRITESVLTQFMNTHQYSAPMSITYGFIGNEDHTFTFAPDKYPFRMVSQPTTYTIQKFVVSASGQELQMSQKPNVTAPKLVFVKTDDSPYMWGSMEWPCKYYNANRVSNATSKVYAVVGEEGDWYKVLGSFNYTNLYSAVGYISKNVVKDAPIRSMTASFLKEKGRGSEAQVFNLAGEEPAIIAWGYNNVGSGAVSVVNIGRIHNGIALMHENQYYGFSEKERQATIGNSTFMGTRLGIVSDGGYWDVDFTKLTDADVRKLLRENGSGNYLYAFVNVGDQAMYIVELGSSVNAHEILFPAAN